MDTRHLFDTLAAQRAPLTTVDVGRAVADGRAIRRRRRAALTAGALSVLLVASLTWFGIAQAGGGGEVAVTVHGDALPASGVGPLRHAYYDWCGKKWSPGQGRAFTGRECLQWRVVTRDGRNYRMPEALSVYTEQTEQNYMNTAAPLVITPDGRRVAYYSEKDERFAVRDLADGRVWLTPQKVDRKTMVKHGGLLRLSPDGRHLGLNGVGLPNAVVDVETGHVTEIPEGWQVVRVPSGGDPVVVGDENNRLGLLSGGQVRAFSARDAGFNVSGPAADGRTLAYLGEREKTGRDNATGGSRPDRIVTIDATTGTITKEVAFRDAPKDFYPWRVGHWVSPTEVAVSAVLRDQAWMKDRTITPTLGEAVYAVDVVTGRVRELGVYSFRGWSGDVVTPGF
ncbi:MULTISPECIES: hypothetical protein [Nonomuraea]|uniref:WD40 repeat domain-containing protein n=1 Tax=Nonomuraea mangrovi TaxID=2316207 RepID=A0ABW4TC19_9ACTN